MSDRTAFERLGLPRPLEFAPSQLCFPDGAEFRIEIPSVEGPSVLAEVIRAAESHGVTVNRVSQGSGAMLLKESELREMAELGAAAGLEVALFVGPRADFDTGAYTRSADGPSHYGALRGMRQLGYAVEDVLRAISAGIRSFLIADLGLLTVLVDMQRTGEVPQECVWKISAYMGGANPPAVRALEQLGASTVNVLSDLSVEHIAEMRAVVRIPLDLYLEAPASMGGSVRGHEIADFVRVGAPLYAKFGLRNAQPLYPWGEHLVSEACAIAREKVRRVACALEWLARKRPESIQSQPHASGLGVPRPARPARDVQPVAHSVGA
jgi:hypothetical protein